MLVIMYGVMLPLRLTSLSSSSVMLVTADSIRRHFNASSTRSAHVRLLLPVQS
jgi:hypothetical protein